MTNRAARILGKLSAQKRRERMGEDAYRRMLGDQSRGNRGNTTRKADRPNRRGGRPNRKNVAALDALAAEVCPGRVDYEAREQAPRATNGEER